MTGGPSQLHQQHSNVTMESAIVTVVIPVFNEAMSIEEVVLSARRELQKRKVPSLIWICDDGSVDASAKILERLARLHNDVVVVRQSNQGHGAAIRRGYESASSPWILQIDGDGEIPAEFIGALWDSRGESDLVLGRRHDDRRHPVRKLISMLTRLTVRWTFGSSVSDPNVPCRLMRRDAIVPLLDWIPMTTFAPNVALSGLARASGKRIVEIPVSMHARERTRRGFRGIKLYRAAVRAWWETVAIGLQFRALRRKPRPQP